MESPKSGLPLQLGPIFQPFNVPTFCSALDATAFCCIMPVMEQWMGRLTLIEADALAVTAGAVVVEDDGRLGATRGMAAEADAQHGELRAQRARAAAEHNGVLPLGAVVPCHVHDDPRRSLVVWAVTWNAQRDAAPTERATPLLIDAVTRRALRAAMKERVQHVAMPALGTRLEHHALPPIPKKLPRYVMGAAQLIGIGQALHQYPSLQVTVCLTQRDLQIWRTLLGQAEDTDNT